MAEQKIDYLKSNLFTVEFENTEWSAADKKALSDSVLKAIPTMTENIVDVYFSIPTEPRVMEMLLEIVNGGLEGLVLQTYTKRGGPSGPFRIIMAKGRCLKDAFVFDYEDAEELVFMTTLAFWEGHVVVAGQKIEVKPVNISVINPNKPKG